MPAFHLIATPMSLGLSAALLAVSGCSEESQGPAGEAGAVVPAEPAAAPSSPATAPSPSAAAEAIAGVTPAPPGSGAIVGAAQPPAPPPVPASAGAGAPPSPPPEPAAQAGASALQPEPSAAPSGGTGGAPAQPGMGTLTGGTAGMPSQGEAGAAPQPPRAGAPANAQLGCSGNELLCEDFEAVAEGGVPGGAWQPLGASCEFQVGTFQMGVSSEQSNGGSQSLKVTNKHFPDCRLSGQFQAVDSFWVRAYMYWEPELDTTNRETLVMDLTPGHVIADDPAVRFGYRSKAPCEDYAGPQVTIIGIGGGEATGCGARELPRGQWYCFEAQVQQAAGLDVRTFVNGEAITYQSIGKPLTESVKAEGVPDNKLDHLRLGIFSTGEAQGSIFVDDIAVSESRVGCAP